MVDGNGIGTVSIKDNQIIAVPIEEALNTPRESRKKLQNLFERLV